MEGSTSQNCRVDSRHLIMPTLTALPKRCIITNEELPDELYEVWDLPAIPKWLVMLMYFGGPFFLITAPYIRQRCKVKAGLSRRERKKRLLKRSLMACIILSPLPLLGITVATGSFLAFGVTQLSVPVSYLTLIAFMRTLKPLTVRKAKNGLFWVDGFSKKFLESLTTESLAAPMNR